MIVSKILSIRVHYTWIFMFALVTAIVTTQFSENYPLSQRVIFGGVVAMLFLLAATIREFILNVAIFYRVTPVRRTTLFPFGGVYQENKARIVPTHWPLLYLAKFLSNLIIAAIFYGLYATFINAGNLIMAGLAQWLAYIYFLLFLLHFIPAFPLDGGEILRMFLWRSSSDYYKSTHIATLIGLSTSFFLIFTGVLVLIITRQWVIGLPIVSIGWFIQIAAGYTRRKIKTLMVLQHIKAQDIIAREYPTMPQQVNIGQLIREHILVKGLCYIIVIEGTKLKGILTMNQIKAVPVKRWNNTTIGDIMTPFDQIRTAHPQQTADNLLEEMDQRGIDYIPVLKDDNIIGVVTRHALMSLVEIRAGFGV